MPRKNTSRAYLPVVSSAMAQPFLAALLGKGITADDALYGSGLSLADVQDGSAPMLGQDWYNLAERTAEVTGDPHFGFRIGSEDAIYSHPNFRTVTLTDTALGEVLTKLIVDAEQITSLATYELRISGCRAVLSSERQFKPARRPRQVDGYFAGFMCRLIREACGEAWKPSDLTVRVSDPVAIPSTFAPGLAVRRGDSRGARFEFPAPWLLLHIGGAPRQLAPERPSTPEAFLSDFRRLLDLHLHKPSLSLERFSEVAGMKARRIKSVLTEHGTSYKAELDHRRAERAKALLKDQRLGYPQVGELVGYPDPSAFSRVFKRWTGQTPGTYRG